MLTCAGRTINCTAPLEATAVCIFSTRDGEWSKLQSYFCASDYQRKQLRRRAAGSQCGGNFPAQTSARCVPERKTTEQRTIRTNHHHHHQHIRQQVRRYPRVLARPSVPGAKGSARRSCGGKPPISLDWLFMALMIISNQHNINKHKGTFAVSSYGLFLALCLFCCGGTPSSTHISSLQAAKICLLRSIHQGPAEEK